MKEPRKAAAVGAQRGPPGGKKKECSKHLLTGCFGTGGTLIFGSFQSVPCMLGRFLSACESLCAYSHFLFTRICSLLGCSLPVVPTASPRTKLAQLLLHCSVTWGHILRARAQLSHVPSTACFAQDATTCWKSMHDPRALGTEHDRAGL